MFRSLIALVVAFAISITGVVKPAYADSNLKFLSTNLGVTVITQGNNNSVSITDSFKGSGYSEKQEPSDAFIDGLVNGAITTLGLAIGGAAVCYAVGAVGTTVFPPAGALIPFCPAISTTFSGGNAVAQGVKAVAKAL